MLDSVHDPSPDLGAVTHIVTSVSFRQGFDQLRIEGLLCDVTLVAGDGDEAFPVHRAMMASSSDYFKAMFTGESTKPGQNICLTIVAGFPLQILLHIDISEFPLCDVM